MKLNEIYLGDCLDVMKNIPDGSVDMILADLPYGTTACKWDSIIPFEPLWEQYKRVVKASGSIVLFASQPFTSALVLSNAAMFKYCLVWEKEQAHSALNAKHQPLKVHEDIVVFSRASSTYSKKETMTYNPQMEIGKPYKSNKNKDGKHSFHGLISTKESTVNDGTRYPKSVIGFNRDRGLHPTQKPVALFEYLIRTYTNEGEAILDNVAGSGTTAIACINTNRNYILIEKDEHYYQVAKQRIEEHKSQLDTN